MIIEKVTWYFGTVVLVLIIFFIVPTTYGSKFFDYEVKYLSKIDNQGMIHTDDYNGNKVIKLLIDDEDKINKTKGYLVAYYYPKIENHNKTKTIEINRETDENIRKLNKKLIYIRDAIDSKKIYRERRPSDVNEQEIQWAMKQLENL